MLRRQRERREKASWRAKGPRAQGGWNKAFAEDFSLSETHLGLQRAFREEVLFGAVWIERLR